MKFIFFILCVSNGLSQTLNLTLEEAREIALQNHPTIAASNYQAQAAAELKKQLKSSLGPQVSAGLSGAAAPDGGRLALAGVQSSLLISRVGAGTQVSQLLSDFGRTNQLMAAADARAAGQRETVKTSRLQVLIGVDRAYYSLLRARVVVRVAEATVKARELVVDQVSALAGSQLRSTLDLSFAKVSLTDAKLFEARARNEVASASAELASALGMRQQPEFIVSDTPSNNLLPSEVEDLVLRAARDRPELRQFALELQSNASLLEAEKRSMRPTISALGVVGVIPVTTFTTQKFYGSASISLNIPLWNGRLFESRQNEIALRTRALEKVKQERENQISRDVRTAYLQARTAFERMGLSRELSEQARLSMELAQARYDLGLGSIVELNQAQLNLTTAEVADVSARYEYQMLRSLLRYQIGEGEI